MSRSKTLTTVYKDTKIEFDLSTKKFSVNSYDLKGEYDTIEAAEKAIREWLNPEKAEKKEPMVKVLVASRYSAEDGFKEATTRFAVKESNYSYDAGRVWVTYTGVRKYSYEAHKEVVDPDRIYADTAENRATFAAIAAKKKEKEAAVEKFGKEIDAIAKKLKVAKKA